jgi:LacI family transcriptional regulator
MSRKPTIRDVAALAGVSIKTVSRVINAENGVSAATSSRVVDAVEQLGFQPNHLARSLRQGRTSATLGLIIEDAGNPFYSAIVQAVERAASQRGHLLITASCEEDPVRERQLVQSLLRRRVDALLLVPTASDHTFLARETADGTPVVFLDRPPTGIEADHVLLDNLGGARAAVTHLLAHGHERIAFIGDLDTLYTTGERLEGYRQALQGARLPLRDDLVRTGSHDASRAEEVVAELLSLPAGRRPTALFAANNRNTVGALRAMRAAGGGVALVGFDDFELADLLALPVTVVRHDTYGMGARASELAFDRLADPDAPPRRIVLPTEIIVRGSGEVPPP